MTLQKYPVSARLTAFGSLHTFDGSRWKGKQADILNAIVDLAETQSNGYKLTEDVFAVCEALQIPFEEAEIFYATADYDSRIVF